ncbi:MAG: DnaD domain protein [Peptoniphilaceae bacterium]|nr:DnaD domain protein [Peptoniphilaceae bacterium]
MKAKMDLSVVDFRNTPIENLFLDTYLAQASGDAIKVYLYGWKTACGGDSTDLDPESLARHLDMDEEIVAEALQYWENEGLLQILEEEEGLIVRFRSMLMLWGGLYNKRQAPENLRHAPETSASSVNTAQATISTEDIRERTRHTEPSKTDSEDAAKSRARAEMFHRLDDLLSEGLSYRVTLKENEIRLILDILDRYPIEPSFFLHAYRRAIEQSEAGSRSVNYIAAIVENWIRLYGVTTEKTLDELIEQKSRKRVQSGTRRTAKKQPKNVKNDTRMSKKEREEWVKKKLEQSMKKSLRGDL